MSASIEPASKRVVGNVRQVADFLDPTFGSFIKEIEIEGVFNQSAWLSSASVGSHANGVAIQAGSVFVAAPSVMPAPAHLLAPAQHYAANPLEIGQ